MHRNSMASLWFSPIWAAVAMAGCSSLAKQSADTQEPPGKTVRLIYRTESDRLSLSPAAAQPQFGLLPGLTTGTLEVRHPHPAGRDGYALATVVFASGENHEPSLSGNLWNMISGFEEAAVDDTAPAFREVWTMDVPSWQLDAVLAKLEKSKFFRPGKVFGTKAFLATEINGDRCGKEFKEIAELDAMIVRVRYEGRPLLAGPGASPLERLPAVMP